MGFPAGRVQNKKKTPLSKSSRCGLVFPVGRVHRLLKKSKFVRAPRISVSAAVYMTSVLEYLTSEVADLAGRVIKSCKLKTVTPRSIMLAIHQDDELFKMMSKVTFPFSGVMPSILPDLLPKKSSRPTTPAVKQIKPKILHTIKMPMGQSLKIVQTDIVELYVDAVVNPTNSALYMGGMVGTRLMQVGGSEFAKIMQDARTEISHLQKNESFVTKGSGTKAKNVIHTNGPMWDANRSNECISDLRETVKNCLAVADKKGFSSIALPSIGSGKAKFPKAIAAEVIVQTIKTHLDKNKTKLDDVRFVLFDKESIDAYIYELNRTT
nr:H2A histone family member Y [Hymenolepis microstoma]